MTTRTADISIHSRHIPDTRQYCRAIIKRCIALLVTLCCVYSLQAQLSFRLSENHINLKDKALGTITIRVVNRGQAPQSATLKVIVDKELQLVTQMQVPVRLNAGDSIFIPVKVFNRAGLSAGDHRIRISLLQGNATMQTALCTVNEPRKRSAALYCLTPTIQLLSNEDSVTLPVKVANTGNVSAALSIVVNLPSDLESQVFHKPVSMRLGPGRDTVLYIKRKMPRRMPSSGSFQVNVLGFFENDNQFGQVGVQVQRLESRRNGPYDPPPHYIMNVPGSFTFSTLNAFSRNAYYWFNGGSSVYLPNDARLAYHTNATVYQYDPQHPYLGDTWLNFETHGKGVTTGNISRSFDLNLYGRGALAYVMDSAHKNYYEGGLMDNASNLLQSSGTIFSKGRTAWGEFRHQTDNITYQSAAVYQNDPVSGTNNLLLTNDISWFNKKHFQFSASLDGGSASGIQDTAKHKAGVLASFNATGNIGNWSINSVNMYSTPYYPGQRKGAQVASERIAYRLHKTGLWAAFNYYHYQPKFVSSFYRYASEYGSTRAELGVSTSWNRFSASLSPYYTTDNNLFYTISGKLNARIRAWRMAIQINYNDNDASVYLNTETGIGKNYLTDKNEFQFHLNSNLRYRFFNISSNVQLGSFYAGDALNNYLAHRSRYEIVNISPNLQHNFLHNALSVSAGLAYNYFNSSGKNITINGRAQYTLSPNSSVSAIFMRYSLNTSNYAYNNLQLSYTQKLPEARAGTQKNTLVLFFYKDVNDNGVYNAGIDSIAAGEEVNVGNTGFITDRAGKIIYKNLPKGNYAISVLKSGRWHADNQNILLDSRKLTVQIPMHKTGTVEGNLTYDFTQYSYELNRQKQGLTIKATDENGNTVATMTDDYGHYLFYLPAGHYSISLNLGDLPAEIQCDNNGKEVQVTANSYTSVNFVLHVKERHIETKKFYSSSLAKTALNAASQSDTEVKTKEIQPK